MERDDWFSLAELHQRLGGLVWVEDQLAQVLHRWAQIEPLHKAAVLFSSTAAHHRWHREVIASCLATSAELGGRSVIEAPSAGWEHAVGVWRALDQAEATTLRLRSLIRLTDPWLAREIGALTGLARPVSDASMSRWLRFVEIDHHDDGRAIGELLASVDHDMVRFDDHRMLASIDLTS